MGILEFLELLQIQYEKFSKERSRLINKWKSWEPSFKITGTGKDAKVSADSFDVFYFYNHARLSWGIADSVDFRLLYEVYKVVLDRDGRYMPPYATLGSHLGVHQNTIAKYVNILEAAGIIKKQAIYEAANRKRIKALPMFHNEFRYNLLKPIPEEIDWYNHTF